MKTMAAGSFKTHCLSVIDEVHDLKEEVVITKHGKPMARLIPFRTQPDEIFGILRGIGKITGDVIEPITPRKDWSEEIFPSESKKRKNPR